MDESPKDTSSAGSAIGIDYKGVVDRLEKVSDRISSQVRTLGLGILAFSWGLLVGQSPVASDVAHSLRFHLLLIGTLTIVALMLDFLQYVSGYIAASNVRATMERERRTWGEFDYTSLPYRLQDICFKGKQVLMIVTATWLVVAILAYLVAKVF